MTQEQILKREGNLLLKNRGGNFIVYLLPFMEFHKTFIDEIKAEEYFNKLKGELF